MNNKAHVERVKITLILITCHWCSFSLQALIANEKNKINWLPKNFIAEESDNLCSYYCAATLSEIYNCDRKILDELFLDASNGSQISAKHLQKQIKKMGLYAKATKMKSGESPPNNLWLVAYLHPNSARDGHFVLAKKIRNNDVLVVDGAKTKVLPLNVFSKHSVSWKGEALLISNDFLLLYKKEMCLGAFLLLLLYAIVIRIIKSGKSSYVLSRKE